MSVFSSVDPAYGSSPFSPWPGGCLCSFCSATLAGPRGEGEKPAYSMPLLPSQGHPDPQTQSYLLSSSSVSPESSAPLSCPAGGSLVNVRPLTHVPGRLVLHSLPVSSLSTDVGIPTPNLNCPPDPLRIQLGSDCLGSSPTSLRPESSGFDKRVWVSSPSAPRPWSWSPSPSSLRPRVQPPAPPSSGSDLTAPPRCRYRPGALVRLVWSLLGLGVSGVSWVLLPEGAWLWSGDAEEGGWVGEGGRGHAGVSRQEAGVESLGHHDTHVLQPTPPSPTRAGGVRPVGEAWVLHPRCCHQESPLRPHCSSLAPP